MNLENNIDNSELMLAKLSGLITKAIAKINSDKLEIESLYKINESLEDAIAKETNYKLSLQERNEELEARLENLTGNNSYYADLVKSLELSIEKNSHYKTDYELIKEKYEKMLLENAELKEKSNFIPALLSQIDELKSNNSDLDGLNKSYISTIGKYEKALTDKELIQKDLTAKNLRIHELINEIQKYKEKLAVNESQLLKAKDNTKILENYKSQLNELEISSNTKIEKMDSHIYQLSLENSQLKAELNSCKINIGNIENDKSILQNINNEANELIDNLKNDNSELNNKVETINQLYENLLEENKLLKSSVDTNLAEFNLAANELSTLQVNNMELLKEIEILEGRNSALKYEIEELKAYIVSLDNKYNELNSDASRYQLEIDNLKSELNIARDEVAINYNNQLILIEQKNDEIANQLNIGKEELYEKNIIIKTLQNRIDELNSEINSLKAEISELNIKISINDANEEKLLERTSKLEGIIKTRYEQINLLEQKINSLLEEKQNKDETKSMLINTVKMMIEVIDKDIKTLQGK